MKALSITMLAALCFALVAVPAYATIPARTATPTVQAASGSGGLGADMAVTMLFVAGIFVAGVAAVFLIRRSGSA
jgi:hypothetical protein